MLTQHEIELDDNAEAAIRAGLTGLNACRTKDYLAFHRVAAKIFGMTGLLSLERCTMKDNIVHLFKIALKETNKELGVCGACVLKLIKATPDLREAQHDVLVKDKTVACFGKTKVYGLEVYLDDPKDARGTCKLCGGRSDIALIVSGLVTLKAKPEVKRSQLLADLQSIDGFLKTVDDVFGLYLRGAQTYFSERFKEQAAAAARDKTYRIAEAAVDRVKDEVIASKRYQELLAQREKLTGQLIDLIVMEVDKKWTVNEKVGAVPDGLEKTFDEFVRRHADSIVNPLKL